MGVRKESASALPEFQAPANGLSGIRPKADDPLTFKYPDEFICVYATSKDIISFDQAQQSTSDYIWCTSTAGELAMDPQATYLDAAHNHHYGRYINDMCSDDGMPHCSVLRYGVISG